MKQLNKHPEVWEDYEITLSLTFTRGLRKCCATRQSPVYGSLTDKLLYGHGNKYGTMRDVTMRSH
jgi:hypothetical protein